MPRTWRALQGWHKLHIHGEGAPELMEVLAVMEDEMRREGRSDEADALAVATDCWLRGAEVFGLRGEDVVLHKEHTGEEGGVLQAVLRIGVAERGEAATTGMRQGVRVDSPYVVQLLAAKKAGR